MDRIVTGKARGLLTGGVLAAVGLAAPALAETRLHILHINDLHSRIEPINQYDSTCSQEDDAAGACFGGVARLATKVAELRGEIEAAGEPMLLLDAGDQFQGSLIYTTYKGEIEAEMMTAIGFDAMAVGNHEFDDGPPVLATFVDAVPFPVISGNTDVASEPALAGKIDDHVVLEVDGLRIGIVSALASDTGVTSSPGPNVTFADEVDALAEDVAALEADGVTHILALTHVGLPRDLEIAEQVPGLDAVIGGHSHTLLGDFDGAAGPYPTMVGDVPVVTARAFSKYLGHLILTFDDDGVVTAIEGAPILLDASVPPDADIAARVAELAGPIEALKAEVVGASAGLIEGSREVCRAEECAMGNLVAEAMLDRVADQGVQVAITNGGGLRASIDEGEVTMGEVLTVLPFQNTLSTFTISGRSIVDALENGVSLVEEGAGRFPQVAGLKFIWDPAAGPNEGRIQEVWVASGEDAFVPIDPQAEYLAVTNNFVRNGGDGYAMFEDAADAYDFGPGLEQVVADYLAERSAPYEPFTDGRIARAE